MSADSYFLRHFGTLDLAKVKQVQAERKAKGECPYKEGCATCENLRYYYLEEASRCRLENGCKNQQAAPITEAVIKDPPKSSPSEEPKDETPLARARKRIRRNEDVQ